MPEHNGRRADRRGGLLDEDPGGLGVLLPHRIGHGEHKSHHAHH